MKEEKHFGNSCPMNHFPGIGHHEDQLLEPCLRQCQPIIVKERKAIYPYEDTCLVGWIPEELADVDIVWIMSHIVQTIGKRDVYKKAT